MNNNPINYLVLDFKKPEELFQCLTSIRENTEFKHKIVVLNNGSQCAKNQNYHELYRRAGLIDLLINNPTNEGLGIGTKRLIQACDSEFYIYFQNDQILARKFAPKLLMEILFALDVFSAPSKIGNKAIKSVSLAGSPCGVDIFSERAYIGKTEFYRSIKGMPDFGAGPLHDGMWQEEFLQKLYKENEYIHAALPNPLVIDNGYRAIRQNPDGSIWSHEPATKRLTLIQGPVKEQFIYPRLDCDEWLEVLTTQRWPEGKIPKLELKSSFIVPAWESKFGR